MIITPEIKYDDRKDNSIRPSWNANKGYVNEEHRIIFDQTKDIPGWQMEGDSYKLYEMGYFAGDVILEIGTYGGRSSVVELRGALSNKSRKKRPQFFGIDIDRGSIEKTYNTLVKHSGLIDYSLLWYGDLEKFLSDVTIQPTMVFLDGDHRYEGVKRDLELLSRMLCPGIPVLCHDYLNPENDTGEYGIQRAATEWEGAGFAEFYGVFGCSVLFVTSDACKGAGTQVMSSEEFTQIKDNLLGSYGLIKTRFVNWPRLWPFSRKKSCHSDAPPVSSETMPLLNWLKELPERDGIVFISKQRGFAHDETKYDEQYESDPIQIQPGLGLTELLRDRGADFSMPALEIGCGTGKLSLGLVKRNIYPLIILTDPFVTFLKIVRSKLQQIAVDTSSVRFAVLKAEEIDRLSKNTLSLIALRSTLHHILEVPKFIQEAARALAPGGFLVFQEPCVEGFVLMGTMAQFIPCVIEKAGGKLSKRHLKQINLFIDTMRSYARRDLDKTDFEDKHLFRADEIMNIGVSAGFAVEFLPNMTFERYFEFGEFSDNFFSFHDFFRDYLKYCMNFDKELIKVFEQNFQHYNQFIEDISANNNAPHCHGVFLCRKL